MTVPPLEVGRAVVVVMVVTADHHVVVVAVVIAPDLLVMVTARAEFEVLGRGRQRAQQAGRGGEGDERPFHADSPRDRIGEGWVGGREPALKAPFSDPAACEAPPECP